MKKQIIFLVLALTGLTVTASPVEPQQAVQVARNFVAQYVKAADQMEATVVYTHPMPKSGIAAMYAVNVGNMFVLVSADDVAHPVLGYSLSRPWPTAKRSETNVLPSQITAYLDDMAGQIEAVAGTEPDRETLAEWQQLLTEHLTLTTNVPDSVGPLLTTTWDQGQYYNALCPGDANGPAGHVYTGCVATAMAQIINYWGYPVHGRGTHSYQHDTYGTLSVNYDSATYDYAHMPTALTATSTPQEVQAVATLMRDCGVAANMDYGPNESSSYDVDARAGLINFFRLSPDLSYAEKAYFTNAEWETMLRTDIAANRPVMYSGHGDVGGHTFICDGYKQDGYFHFNFGWSGYADGWYLTSVVSPAGMAFNSDQTALLGIVPDSTGNVILGQMAGTSTFSVDEPLEFYHLMGHNAYLGANYSNACYNDVNFISADTSNHLVVDIIVFEDQELSFDDESDTNGLRILYGGGSNDLSPILSSGNTLTVYYSGSLYYTGFELIISQDEGCRRVSNIYTNVNADTVSLAWIENGTAIQWEVEYGITGFELGNGTTYITTTNTVTFSNLQTFTEYDFYIRPVCGNNQPELWNKVTVMVEAAYWQDVVTLQPEGYVYNSETRMVEISTAEGFAWWTKYDAWEDALLTADINLSGYKWRPQKIFGTLNGHGHVISNAYINENGDDVGLFSSVQQDAVLEDVGLVNSKIIGHGSRTGGLCGALYGTIRNSYVTSSIIEGNDFVGGLTGLISVGAIINSYVNVNVAGRRWTGLLVGILSEGHVGGNVIVRNCYAAGRLRYSFCYSAGIVAYATSGVISNCFSVETSMGVVGYKGETNIFDTSTFVLSDAGWTLLTPIVFDDVVETDLIAALNRGVELYNDSMYCTWIADTGNVNGGYPVFGNKYNAQCPNVSEVSIQNVKINNNNAVIINWVENGDASQWKIRYRRHDQIDSLFTYIIATTNPDTLFEVPPGYVYDFNIRAICDTNIQSGWGATSTVIVDVPYWTDIVTTQPAGYMEDSNGNIEISTAEGLAWLSILVNGFQGHQPNSFEGTVVTLTSNINLGGYRWNPIGRYINMEWTGFSGVFDGQNHTISNIYINDERSGLGLFGHVNKGWVKNVNIEGGMVASIYTDQNDFHSPKSSAIGGLIGYATDCYEISNCHSSATIYALGSAGSLCGLVNNGMLNYNSGISTIISNCSASGTVYGRQACGGLIGEVYAGDANGDIEVRNSYATGDVLIVDGGFEAWYRGGLIGLFLSAKAYNCYSTGTVTTTNDYMSRYYGKVIGAPALNTHIHYIYGQDNVNVGWDLIGDYCPDIADTAQIHHEGDSSILLSAIYVDGIPYSYLLDALNAWVTAQGDPTLRTWTLDNSTGYPVFGNYYQPSCYFPTDFTVSQATEVGDTIIKTQLAWTQVGEPEYWEVAYVASERSIDSSTIITVTTNPCILTEIPVGQPLDFYIRAVCDSSNVSGWSNVVTYIPDKLRWTEVVTSQPEGYQEDADGNVYISSAEGLAWLSSVVNGLNGVEPNNLRFLGKRIELLSDIDISRYRWVSIGHRIPIGNNNNEYYLWGTTFNGNGHIIRGLYCNELDNSQGLFGCYSGGVISNLKLIQCVVYGEKWVGAIGGYVYAPIINCAVEGDVYGILGVGGIAGEHGNGIKNSFFKGNVATRTDITPNNAPRQDVGGICGTMFGDSVVNCYVVTEVSDDESMSGIITGTSGGNVSVVTNCYYRDYATTLPVTGSGYTTYNISSFNGSDSIWTLTTPAFINGTLHTDLVETLNAWVDANNTNGQYRRWATDSTNENDGYPVFDFIPCTPATSSDSITVCDSYTWHGTIYTADAVLIETLSTITGCDSTVTLYLTINNTVHNATTEVACDSFFWSGQWLVASGQYVDTLTNAAGCDSTVTLHLTVNHSNTGDTTATACDSYFWSGQWLVASGQYVDTLTNAAGCDSTVTLHLTVNHSNSGDTTATACDSYFWNGQWLVVSGQYVDTLTNAVGCDSTVTLHLTINNPIHTATTEEACDSFLWCGQWLVASDQYLDSHPDANGCTQVDTLYLTIHYSVETTVADSAEESYTWNGETYTESGTYSWTGMTAEGCDSTVTLTLIITHIEGIDGVDALNVKVYSSQGQIVVEGAEGHQVCLYDVTGRVLTHSSGTHSSGAGAHASTTATRRSPSSNLEEELDGRLIFNVPASGVYLIKIGAYPARRVVVVK